MKKIVTQEQQMAERIKQLVVESEQIESIVEIIKGLAASNESFGFECSERGSSGE